MHWIDTPPCDIACILQWKIRQLIGQYNDKKNACHATEKLETPHL